MVLAGLELASYSDAAKAIETDQDQLQIAMPIEYINYTVSQVNGSFWASVEGVYPMQVTQAMVGQELQMVYPTPPGTIDVSLELDGQAIALSNLTKVEPYMVHYTYLGDWSMVLFSFKPPSSNFTLTIHYQHPITELNGSYAFLYDLNIGTYLSNSSSQSVAHFSVTFPSNCRDTNVYSVPGDRSPIRNNAITPISFAQNAGNGFESMVFEVVSGYGLPLPGDQLVTFKATPSQVPEYPAWVAILLALMVALTIKVFRRRLC